MSLTLEPILRPRNDLTDNQVNAICDVIRNPGFNLHKYLGAGFREKSMNAVSFIGLKKLVFKFRCSRR